MFLRWSGEVEKLPGYTRIRTPSNPSFHWGNFLFFDTSPVPGDEIRWRSAFTQEFPGANYEAIGWESGAPEKDDLSAFEALGLEREVCSVMTGRSVNPPQHPNTEVIIRPLETDSDWALVLENQVLHRSEDDEEAVESICKAAPMEN